VLHATLSNGLEVVIVPNPLAPVAATVVNYRVGSDETPSGFPGTAHALEHMMFRGSPDLSAEQLADISAALGGDSNADTQQAATQYFFTVPVEDLDVALHIEALRMRGILEDPKLWDQERGAIEQEVAQDLSNPEYLFYMKLIQVVFKGTPYEHDALGTRPSFDKTTSAMLKSFHDTWYAPNNAVLVIVGDVQPEKVFEQVRNLFGNIPSRLLPARPVFQFQLVKPELLKFDTDSPEGTAVIAFRFPGSDSPDYAAAQVLADVLSSERGKLYGLVPQGKALSAAFSFDALPKAGVGYATAGFPAGADANALLEQMTAILQDETTNGVVADLVEAAKRLEVADAEFQRNSVFGLAMEWSDAVAVEGRQSPDEDVEAIRRVRVADVNRVARKYLDMEQAVQAILTPQPSGKPVSPKGFGGKESFTPTSTKPVTLPAWAEQAVNRLEQPSSRLHPYVTNFPNGLKLIIQPEDVSDTISVYGSVKSNPNTQEPEGKEGVAGVLEELFSYGTVNLERLVFQKALDDIGATESAGTNFAVQVLPDRLERGVQLLAENVRTPALPEEAFKLVQPQLEAAAAGKLESPGYLVRRALDGALFSKRDPVQRETTPGSLKDLSIQDVRDYHRAVFRPDLTTIVVIGKVTVERAEKVVARYFGDWQAIGPKPSMLLPAPPPNQSATTRVSDASRVQDNVTLAQTLGLRRADPEYYALELGNHVLGGGFYATRLYRDLRENAGLVYFVSSDFDVGETRGVYRVEYACDPPNVSKARAIVLSNLKQMGETDVSDRELRQAKVLLLREIPLSESSVARVAHSWLARSALGLPLDEPVRAAKVYMQLKPFDVRAAFSKWLRPADLVEVTQGPTAK
jgi:zinc protease